MTRERAEEMVRAMVNAGGVDTEDEAFVRMAETLLAAASEEREKAAKLVDEAADDLPGGVDAHHSLHCLAAAIRGRG